MNDAFQAFTCKNHQKRRFMIFTKKNKNFSNIRLHFTMNVFTDTHTRIRIDTENNNKNKS